MQMSRRHAGENLDFSGLFKVDALSFCKISTYSFYELGLKKFISIASDQELLFFYINSESDKFDKKYSWDFDSNPIHCLCFEPSGTWLVVVSDQKIFLVPFLPLFAPESPFDCKWSLEAETELSLNSVSKPTAVAWWLSKESNNYLIIGYKNGSVQFFSMESQTIVGECKVSDEVTNLQMCFDDSLDLLTLLITGSKQQQWRLVLEHRSFGYNWLHQMQQADSRQGNFFNYIKQFSKDKITLFTQQSTSTDNTKPQTVEYVLKPTEYLPSYRKRSGNWSLTAQYVNGRHFLSAFDLNEGTLHIESPDMDSPARTFNPVLKKDYEYTQGLWSQRLIYLLRKNELEIHSAAFAALQDKTAKETLLWSTKLIGTPLFGYVMSAREPHGGVGGWKEPTFLCDLQLPRFALEPCLVITTEGAYLLSTITSPAEWLVSMTMRGAPGCEQSAEGVGAPVPVLLRAACDMLLSRDKLAPAHYLYSLSQCPSDGWMARLGVFGRLQELSMFGLPTGSTELLRSRAITIKLMSILMKIAKNSEEKIPTDTKLTTLTPLELEELSSITAALGLWDLLPIFNLYRGYPGILLKALKNRRHLCRGALNSLVNERNAALMLLSEDSQWLYDFVEENCRSLDVDLLKRLCLWMCPLQQQFRPVLRDLKLGLQTPYTTQLEYLTSTFMQVAAELERHLPNPEMLLQLPAMSRTWIYNFVPKRELSCGLSHWAVCEEGNAKVMGADCPVIPEVVGRVVSVACGRHHTLLLTENGVYAAGDNTYGQLGVGQSWSGAVGEQASATGTFLHVPCDWASPLVAVAAGNYHSAAIDCGGRLFVWGWGVHGQLGLGKIDDELTPQLVTKLQGRKVTSVCLGALHTICLLSSGQVMAWGASVLGQVGRGGRDKCPAPVQVPLPEPAKAIAATYFHNLALCSSGAVYIWGGSGQWVRAVHARDAARHPAPAPAPGAAPGTLPAPGTPPAPGPIPAAAPEPHLSPLRVDVGNLLAPAVAIAAGWHHSAIIDKTGILYTWGLNFDGQLGSADRKLVAIPTRAKFNREIPIEGDDDQKINRKVEAKEKTTTKAIVGCGGDFTVFIDDLGRIYASGNAHVDNQPDSKGSNRVFMMKSTKRVLRLPTHSLHNKNFVFQPIDRIEIMFPFDVNELQRASLDSIQNPVKTLDDFERKTWSDELLLSLFPWIKDENLSRNFNMSRKLAYHSKNYAESLRLSLEDLKKKKPEDVLYLSHTDTSLEKGENISTKGDNKIAISTIIAKRIKELSLSILNDEDYPLINTDIFKSLPCNCDETIYMPTNNKNKQEDMTERNISLEAATILDRCINMFPTDSKLWETCFKLAKDFFIENELSIDALETILRKYTEVNASTMAHAVMFSNDCVQYNKILSPNLYLTMCSKILDTWM